MLWFFFYDSFHCAWVCSTVYTRVLLNIKDKALGLAYTRVMPHSHTLTARVSAAWTMDQSSRPLGLRVGVGARAVGGGTTHCCCGCIPAK